MRLFGVENVNKYFVICNLCWVTLLKNWKW